MRRIVLKGALLIGAIAGTGAHSQAQYYYQPVPPRHHYPFPSGPYVGWKPHGGWYPGGSTQYVGRGGYVTNRFGDGRPPLYNRPGDGLPPLPAYRKSNGQYIVNRPGDGLPPFVVGRPRY